MTNDNEEEGEILGGDVMGSTVVEGTEPYRLVVERDGVVVGTTMVRPDGSMKPNVDTAAAGMEDIRPLERGFAFTPTTPNIETPMVFDEEPPAPRKLAPRDI